MSFKAHRTVTFEVPSALDQIGGATRQLFQFLEELHLDDSDRFDIRLCFEESLINAIKHGNRLRKDLPVKVTAAFDTKEIHVSVADQGRGFDYQRLKDPTKEQNLEAYSGRGVYLVRHLMDRLCFSESGSCVEMIKVYGLSKHK